MSKRKPDEVKEIVIRLQDKERQLLDDYIMSKNLNLVSEPFVEILKDISAMTTLTIAYIAFRYGSDIASQLKGKYDDLLELILDVEGTLSRNKDIIELSIRTTPIVGDIFRIGELFTLELDKNWKIIASHLTPKYIHFRF